MINKEEIKEKAKQQKVPLTSVEKDYVIGWVLWSIYSDNELRKKLILKGANCLRKAYFQQSRFSDDLDFHTENLSPELEFKEDLLKICKKIEGIAGIKFHQDLTRVEVKSIPNTTLRAMDGRIYFPGIAGDESITLRVKFDISEYEKIVLPLQQRRLIHPYSDSHQCNIDVVTYQLEEFIAEKLRSWIQRTRAKDLFDVIYVIFKEKAQINKPLVLSTFLKKTIFKNIISAGRDELLVDQKFSIIEDDWKKTIFCPVIIDFSAAIRTFKDFVNSIFQIPATQPAIIRMRSGGVSGIPEVMQYGYRISSNFREVIIQAGKLRQILKLGYHNLERMVEPYSFRYKNGREYFYGFDRTKDNTIKSFLFEKIESAELTNLNYSPQWTVEF